MQSSLHPASSTSYAPAVPTTSKWCVPKTLSITRSELTTFTSGISNLPRTRSGARNGVPPRTDGQQQEGFDAHYRAIRGRAPRD
jgi:hypothetical protein